MRAEDLKRWLESRQAMDARERQEAALQGPSTASAISSALALVALFGRLHGWPAGEDEVDRRENEEVRRQWARLRAFYGRP
ncbi:MAG: hypothetical protein ACE148_00705 [Vicinamibacterales bacterium]